MMMKFWALIMVLNGNAIVLPFISFESCVAAAQALDARMVTEAYCYNVTAVYRPPSKHAPKSSPLPTSKPGETT